MVFIRGGRRLVPASNPMRNSWPRAPGRKEYVPRSDSPRPAPSDSRMEVLEACTCTYRMLASDAEVDTVG
jgi:hypothetical protein